MLHSFRPKNSSEEEAKFLQERIQTTEKHLADLCDVFSQYTRKAARLRDKSDELAKVAIAYSSNESINKSLALGLENFADSISTLGDYGDLRTQALTLKIIGALSKYDNVCKKAKEEVKDIFAARQKEIQRKRQLDRLRDKNPRNRQLIEQAEADYLKATSELSKTVHAIEERSATFEKQKLHDIKAILLNFISIELGYHAKALEVLTSSFTQVNNINEDVDLEEFKKSLRLSGSLHKADGSRGLLLRSAQSLGSLGSIFSASGSRRPTTALRQSKEKINKQEMIKSNEKKHSESDDDSSEEDNSSDIVEDNDDSVDTDSKLSSDKESPIVIRKSNIKHCN